MSRVILQKKPNFVVVGWDAPEDSFFAQIYDREVDEFGPDDEHVQFYTGYDHQEHPDVDSLLKAMPDPEKKLVTDKVRSVLERHQRENVMQTILDFIQDDDEEKDK